MHFRIWRCIPDVSEEKDVLHVHLLIRHLVPLQSDFFKTSAHVTTMLKTQNVILHFSQSEVLSKSTWHRPPGPTDSLVFSSTPLSPPHETPPTSTDLLNVTWILLLPWLAFSVPEKCREHYHYVSRLFLVQMRSCVGWSVVGSSAQQLYRNGRDCVEISPTGTCPFLTAKYSWFCSQFQPPLDYQVKNFSFLLISIDKTISRQTIKRGCGEKGTLLHCWWECKLVQPLWRTVWKFL